MILECYKNLDKSATHYMQLKTCSLYLVDQVFIKAKLHYLELISSSKNNMKTRENGIIKKSVVSFIKQLVSPMYWKEKKSWTAHPERQHSMSYNDSLSYHVL